MITLKIRRLPNGLGLPLPSYAKAGDACMDLRSAIAVVIDPGCRKLIRTGFAVEIPEGFEGQVRPRSGLALDHGFTVLNAPGTIDSSYRGEVCVIGYNSDTKWPFVIEHGDRIAQLVIASVGRVEVIEVDALSETERGEGGFGSSGR